MRLVKEKMKFHYSPEVSVKCGVGENSSISWLRDVEKVQSRKNKLSNEGKLRKIRMFSFSNMFRTYCFIVVLGGEI